MPQQTAQSKGKKDRNGNQWPTITLAKQASK